MVESKSIVLQMKKACASFCANHFPLRRLNLKNKIRGLALIPIEDSI